MFFDRAIPCSGPEGQERGEGSPEWVGSAGILPAGRGLEVCALKQQRKRVIHEDTRRTTKGHEGA